MTEKESVYCAVRTGSVTIIYIDSRLLKCSVGAQNARFTSCFKVNFKFSPQNAALSPRSQCADNAALQHTIQPSAAHFQQSTTNHCSSLWFSPLQTVQWLRRLVAGLPPRRPGFDPSSHHVRFVVDIVALGRCFFPNISFFSLSLSFHQCSALFFVYMLLLPEGQMVEAVEPSIKQRCFGNRGAVDNKVLYL